MKKLLMGLIMLFVLLPQVVGAENKMNFYFFHGDGCPHCQNAIEYINSIKDKYPNIEIVSYEVWENEDNAELFDNVKKYLGTDSRGVPFVVIGNRYLTGFNDYRKQDIKDVLDYYANNPNEYVDIVSKVKNGEVKEEKKSESKKEKAVNLALERKKTNIKKIYQYSFLLIIVAVIYYVIRKKTMS